MKASFILSCARSGSTLTRFIVDTHPEIYCPAELNLGKLADSLYFSLVNLDGRVDEPLYESEEILAGVRGILSDLLDSKTREKGKRIWCEKTPGNLAYKDLLARIFPDARFVCLHRHGLDVVHSCLERSRYGFMPVLEEYVRRTPGNTLQAAVQYWVDSTSALLDFERKRPERTFRVRYEDIVTSPEILDPMFRFLGVDWSPDLLDSVFTSSHDPGVGDPYVRFSGRIHKDSLGLGRNLPTGALPDDLRRRMVSLLEELGYGEEPGEPAISAISRISERSSKLADDPRETPSWVFDHLVAERLRTGGNSLAPFCCTIVVHGAGEGTWSVEVRDGEARVIPGGETGCRIDLQAEDLLDIVHGRANALKIAREGRIRIDGPFSEEALRQLILLIRTDLEARV